MIIAFDARPLQPQTRHWGVGVVIDSLIERLSKTRTFVGLSHRFERDEAQALQMWPKIPKANAFLFELSCWMLKNFDLYWGTNDFVPWSCKKPAVVTVHDLLLLKYPEDQSRTKLLAWQMKSSLRRAQVVIADSQTTADDLLRFFPELKGKLEVALLGFHVPAAIAKDELRESQESSYVVMLGAHRPRKNLELAVRAVREVNRRNVRMKVVVTGDVHGSFTDLVTQNKDIVTLTGVITREEMNHWLGNSLAMVFPSRYEGFGLPMLEAMAAGIPVLALDTPISREIGGTASCFLSEDPAVWSRAIINLSQNADLVSEQRSRGYENLKRFSWEQTAEVYAHAFARA